MFPTRSLILLKSSNRTNHKIAAVVTDEMVTAGEDEVAVVVGAVAEVDVAAAIAVDYERNLKTMTCMAEKLR